MSKQESVADIIARKKKISTEQPKKEVKKKPAKKRAGVVVGKKKATIKNHKKRTFTKKPKNDIENLKKPDVYLDFIRFIATPDNFRDIQTQGEFAKKFNVEQPTLTNWKKRDGFWDRVRDERKEIMKDKMVNKVIMAVYRKALRDGTSKEAKLLLELSGEYEEKRILDARISNLTPERAKEIDERVRVWDKIDDDEEEETNEE